MEIQILCCTINYNFPFILLYIFNFVVLCKCTSLILYINLSSSIILVNIRLYFTVKNVSIIQKKCHIDLKLSFSIIIKPFQNDKILWVMTI